VPGIGQDWVATMGLQLLEVGPVIQILTWITIESAITGLVLTDVTT
jgi:hypothetical protein